MEKTLDRIAFLLSAISSPFLVIFAVATAIIALASASVAQFAAHWIPFVVSILVLPVAFILIGMRTGKITDIHVREREQRAGPFLLAVAGSTALTAWYIVAKAPTQLLALSVNLLVNGVIFYVVSRYWKASVHSASLVGSAVILAVLVDSAWWWLLIATPAVAWARMRRKRHDIAQAAVAAVMTGTATYASLRLFGF